MQKEALKKLVYALITALVALWVFNVYQAERLNDAVEAVSDVVYGDTREVVITTADGKVIAK